VRNLPLEVHRIINHPKLAFVVYRSLLLHVALRRPVVLFSPNEAYAVRAAVTVAPLTTIIRGIPVEVRLDGKKGLPKACVVNLDSLLTIPRSLLESKITQLSSAKLEEVHRAIRFALNL
jgi:mRNA interferase MazF